MIEFLKQNEYEVLQGINGSKQKWIEIRDNEGEDLGPKNCDLCKLYLKKDCENCPVALYTGQQYCEGTPYEDWASVIDEADHDLPITLLAVSEFMSEEDAKRIVQNEIDFLENLKSWVKKQIDETEKA